MSRLQAALQAASLGFHIFPVARGSKVPHHLAGEWGANATNDFNRIVTFWTQQDPEANVGVACKNSQLLVVDLDQAKEDYKLRGTEWEYMHSGYGARVSGEELIDEMAFKLSESPDYQDDFRTYSVRTGSGGRHLYYWWPEHWPKISQASPVKGIIDVRGNGGQWGGYVLAAGSQAETGPYIVEQNIRPTLPPDWIRKLVVERPQPPKIQRVTGIRQPGAINWSGLVDSVRNAGEGNRNNALHWAARTMYTDRAPLNECLATLGPAAEAAGLGSWEIERTIQSAYTAQAEKEGPQ